MAQQYTANSSGWTDITEESGMLVNRGETSIEICSQSNKVAGQGLVLSSGLKQPFAGSISVRSLDTDTDAIVNILDMTLGGGGGMSNSKTCVQDYVKGTAYTANTLIEKDGSLYLALANYTADTIDNDISAGNLKAVGSDGGSISAWETGKAYKKDNLVCYGMDVYLVVNDYTSGATPTADVTAGNLSLVNSSSVQTQSTDAFMTSAEVDALFA